MTDQSATPVPLILLFDGTCTMCNTMVQFILAHDPNKRFRFAPLQTDFARNLMVLHQLDPDHIDSMVLIDGNRAYMQSTAALRITLDLPEPWPILGALIFVPASLRDQAYAFIARHRKQWFKSSTACHVPTPDQQEQFLA